MSCTKNFLRHLNLSQKFPWIHTSKSLSHLKEEIDYGVVEVMHRCTVTVTGGLRICVRLKWFISYTVLSSTWYNSSPHNHTIKRKVSDWSNESYYTPRKKAEEYSQLIMCESKINWSPLLLMSNVYSNILKPHYSPQHLHIYFVLPTRIVPAHLNELGTL